MTTPGITDARPPVTVLGGFLGAGKTTLLRHLLGQARSAGSAPTPGRPVRQAQGRRWAAVVNDLASVNIDAQLVAQAGAQRVVELGNGCVCCTVRDELGETLTELCATGTYDHILVETTGVAEPRAIARLFTRRNAFGRSVGDVARLSALVTVIDAGSFLASHRRAVSPAVMAPPGSPKPVYELLIEQAECADVIVLNKCDTLPADGLDELERVVRALNPRAEVMRAEHGQLPAELLLDRVRFDPEATLRAARWIRVLDAVGGAGVQAPDAPRHEQSYGITSFVYQERRPLDAEKFHAFLLGGLPAGLLRAKGYFWLAGKPADIGFLSIAGGQVKQDYIGTWVAELRERGVITEAEIPAAARLRWSEPHGDRRQEMVFIGTHLDATALRAALDDCLA